MNERYGLVYLGSKEKILHLIDYIFQREYNKKYFVDLFCGGFSVSAYALRHTKFKVISNDLNKYVVALIDKMVTEKEIDPLFYEWVSRDKFNDVRDTPANYPDWYVGFVLTVWSFGCNQNDYLYAKEIEEQKHALHQAVVFHDYYLFKQFEYMAKFVPTQKTEKLQYKENIVRRTEFLREWKSFVFNSTDYEDKDMLLRLTQLDNLSQTEHVFGLMKNSKYIERLALNDMDWRDMFDMLPEDFYPDMFIYCDPPYQNTKKYQVGRDLDYDAFWRWFRECPCSVYVSSYSAPEDITAINFDFKMQQLDNGHRGDHKQKKYAIENIYWNGKGNAVPTFGDLLFNETEDTK